jgi:hypothetical protein
MTYLFLTLFLMDRHKKILETLDQVKKFVTEVRKYFGDPTDTPEEDAAKVFFTTMTDFAEQYIRALRDIDEWAEQVR